jgi:probable HAF family extracellular repeat protein
VSGSTAHDRRRLASSPIAAVGLAAATTAVCGQASLQSLNFPGDANAVSADGLVVVGAAPLGAFRWTAAGGGQYLPQPAGFTADAFAASADGSVIVGSLEGAGSARVFRWSGGNTQDLGNAPGEFVTRALGVSADGSVLCGQGNTGWFRWTAAGGWVVQSGAATGISAGGDVVVGGAFQNGGSHAFRWTSAGMQDLGTLPNGPLSVAYAVSGDGAVVVGMSYAGPTSPDDYRPFRWKSGVGMVNLGLLPGAQYGWANAVNTTGSAITGQMLSGENYLAFLWTSAGGMQDLRSALAAAGADTTGWALSKGFGISGDGSVIVGTGVGPSGHTSWIAHLPISRACYANCDGSTNPPAVNTGDFTCFLQQYAAGTLLPTAQQVSHYANCDGSTTPPCINTGDFTCFLQKYAAGCS